MSEKGEVFFWADASNEREVYVFTTMGIHLPQGYWIEVRCSDEDSEHEIAGNVRIKLPDEVGKLFAKIPKQVTR